jgi:hypothetical protein
MQYTWYFQGIADRYSTEQMKKRTVPPVLPPHPRQGPFGSPPPEESSMTKKMIAMS